MIRFKDKNYKLPITEKDLLYIINKNLFYELVLYMYKKGYVDMWLVKLSNKNKLDEDKYDVGLTEYVGIFPVSEQIQNIDKLNKYHLNKTHPGLEIVSKTKIKSLTKQFVIKTKPFNLEYICNIFGNELENL